MFILENQNYEITRNRAACNIYRCQPIKATLLNKSEILAVRKGIHMIEWHDASLLAGSLDFYKSMIKLILSTLQVKSGSDADRGRWETMENHRDGHYDAIKYTLPNRSFVYVQHMHKWHRYYYNVGINDLMNFTKPSIKRLSYVDLRRYLSEFKYLPH